MHCALVYGRMGRLQEAESAHLFTASGPDAKSVAHANLARFYLSQGRWKDAKVQCEHAVEKETFPAKRALRRGQMLVELYQWDREKLLEARDQFILALELQPSFKAAQDSLARLNQMMDSE